MQEPQRYRGPDGSVYEALPDGTYRRTPPQGQQAAPAGQGYTVQQMETPATRQAEARLDLQGQREERQTRAAEDTARQAAITATRLSPTEEDQLAEARAMAREAVNVMPDVERFSRLNRGQDSGGLYAFPTFDAIAGAFDSDVSQMNELTSRFAPAQREEGSGPMSDADLALFLRSVPSIKRPRTANEALIERARAEAARRVAYSDFLDQYSEENLTLKGADAAFRAAVVAGEIDIPGGGEPGGSSGSNGGAPQYDADWNELTNEERQALRRGARVLMPQNEGETFRQIVTLAGDAGGPQREPLPGDDVQMFGGVRGIVPGMADAAGALASGAMEQVPGGDEAATAIGALVNRQSWSEARAEYQDMVSALNQQQRGWRNAGGVVGAVAQIPVGGAAFNGVRVARTAANAPRIERVGRLAARTGQNAGIGATGAGIYAAGAAEGGVDERLEAGGNALGIGAAFGAAVPYAPALGRFADDVTGNVVSRSGRAIGEFAGRQAGRVGNAFGIPGSQELVERATPNALTPLADRLVDRLGPERVTALRPRAAHYAQDGVDPTLIDAMDDGGQGLIRAAGSRQAEGAGRQGLVDFHKNRIRNLPTQARRIASEEISDDARPALDIIESQKQVRRDNASAIDTFGNDPVPLNPDLSQALHSPLARQAFRDAADRAETSVDPLERAAGPRLRALAEGRANATALTVREAQDISKALGDTARAGYGRDASAPALDALGRSIRQTARDSSDGYAAWLRQYGEDSDLIEAATRGRNFVSVSKDPASVRGTEAFIRGASDAGDAESAIQRAVSAEAVATTASNPRGARTVLDAFAGDLDQARRATAIGADADRLQSRSRTVLDSVENAYNANPRGGSNSMLNFGDAGNLAGMGEMAKDVQSVARGGPMGVLDVMIRRYRSRGFSNAEADQLARLAPDASRADEFIDLLSQRMTRREARREARSSRHQALATTQSGQQSPE